MLTTEDPAVAADTERFAVEVAARAKAPGGILDEALKRELATVIAERDAAEVMATVEPTVADRYEAVDVTLLGGSVTTSPPPTSSTGTTPARPSEPRSPSADHAPSRSSARFPTGFHVRRRALDPRSSAVRSRWLAADRPAPGSEAGHRCGSPAAYGVGMSKVALVTGASSGIGESVAVHLVATGWTVYAVARRVERMAALESRGITTFAMDVTDDASMVAGIDRILTEQGRIDALVNNAGYGSYGPVEHVPIDDGRRQFEVNVFGLARLTQLVIPHMRTRRSGRIVNISSIGGKIYEPLGAWYHATKFAVEGFSDSLRIELAPFGIDVVIVEPGPILSEWNAIARDEHGRAVTRHRLRGPRVPDGRAVRAGRHRADELRARGGGREGPHGPGGDQPGRPLSRRTRRSGHRGRPTPAPRPGHGRAREARLLRVTRPHRPEAGSRDESRPPVG